MRKHATATIAMSACPHCHQPIVDERLGVRLTPLNAAIVDRVKRAGNLGISSQGLLHDLYLDRRPVSVTTLKAHVSQINSELVESTDWVIASDQRRWFLRRRNSEAAE